MEDAAPATSTLVAREAAAPDAPVSGGNQAPLLSASATQGYASVPTTGAVAVKPGDTGRTADLTLTPTEAPGELEARRAAEAAIAAARLSSLVETLKAGPDRTQVGALFAAPAPTSAEPADQTASQASAPGGSAPAEAVRGYGGAREAIAIR